MKLPFLTVSMMVMGTLGAFAATGTLVTFRGMPGGAEPTAPLITGSVGNLYGTTHAGGAASEGTVFELSPNGSGQYTFHELYAFKFAVGDAEQPDNGPLLVDSAGNLYGTIMYGGLGVVWVRYTNSAPWRAVGRRK